MKKPNQTFEDICTHTADDYQKHLGAVITPLFQNSLFIQKKGEPYGSGEFIYSRMSNPTLEVTEKKMAEMERGQSALCFSSGMGAISSGILSCIGQDAHVICVRNVYGPTRSFLEVFCKRFGIETTFVPGTTLQDFEKAIRPNTKLIYLESPTTFVFWLQDIEQVCQLAKANHILTMIDNTWATPLYQQPIEMGVDIVMHTASKYIGGHSDIVAGALISDEARMIKIREEERAWLGNTLDPHTAWLMTRGMRTLPVRMEKHQQQGIAIATFLENHPRVKQVFYPGLKSHPQQDLIQKQLTGYSGLLSLIPAGTDDQILEFVNALQWFQTGCSWGGFESLVIPIGFGMDGETEERLGIPHGLVRISVGLENLNTLLEDLDQALAKLPLAIRDYGSSNTELPKEAGQEEALF